MTLQGFADGEAFGLTRQEGERFFGSAVVDNQAWSAYVRLKVVGTDGGAVQDVAGGRHFLARTPESYAYDADGNLVSDGRWNYQWDAENRLVGMETRAEAVSGGAPKMKLAFGDDADHRRFSMEVYEWNTAASAYELVDETRFVYEGWNVLAELDETNAPVRLYRWGLDMSGTREGAGGLLAMREVGDGKTYFYRYDGNGNVMGLVDAADGSVAAEYEYGPFGESIRVSGPMAEANRFRFSTKWEEGESGLLYYGYRYYHPETGRWFSRDPIGEEGGTNVYAFVLGFCGSVWARVSHGLIH